MRKPYPLRGRANGQRKETRARAGASVRARCRIVCGPCWRIVRGPHTRKHAQGARGRHPPPEYEQTQLIRVARALLSLILLRMLVLLQLSLSRALFLLSPLSLLSLARARSRLSPSHTLSLSIALSQVVPLARSRLHGAKQKKNGPMPTAQGQIWRCFTRVHVPVLAGIWLICGTHIVCVVCVCVRACMYTYILHTYRGKSNDSSKGRNVWMEGCARVRTFQNKYIIHRRYVRHKGGTAPHHSCRVSAKTSMIETVHVHTHIKNMLKKRLDESADSADRSFRRRSCILLRRCIAFEVVDTLYPDDDADKDVPPAPCHTYRV